MSWFNIDDELHGDPRFRQAGLDAFGLYAAAGSWCLGDVRGRPGPLPKEWLVPDYFVAGWPSGAKAAKKLVTAGLWEKVDAGYRFAWIRESNTPAAVSKRRQVWNAQKKGNLR